MQFKNIITKMPLFVGLIFMACEKPIEMNDMEIQEKGPDQEGWNVTIYLSDEGSLTAKIRAGHLEKYHEKQFALLDSGVVIDFF